MNRFKFKFQTKGAKIILSSFILSIALSSYAYGYKGQPYAEALKIQPKSLATQGWYNVFSSEEGMREYGIYQLTPKQRSWLKRYLLDHASDAHKPSISGLYKDPKLYKKEDLER